MIINNTINLIKSVTISGLLLSILVINNMDTFGYANNSMHHRFFSIILESLLKVLDRASR